MRIIKFRVFNKKTNRWVHGPHKDPSMDGCNLFGEHILLGGFMHGVGVKGFNDCVACQFTGLTDKNDKEIFEHDIVKGFVDFREDSVNGDVYTFTGEIYYQAPGFFGKNADFPLDTYELEVIGNVFENQLCQES